MNNVQTKTRGKLKLHNSKLVKNRNANFVTVSRSTEIAILDEHGRERERYKIPYGAELLVPEGKEVQGGQVVAQWDPHTRPIITEMAGRLRFVDMKEGITVNRQADEVTGLTSTVVIDTKQRSSSKELRPMVKLVDDNGNDVMLGTTTIPVHYYLPVGSMVNLEDGAKVEIGDTIARIPQESSKTRDITGGFRGLPTCLKRANRKILLFWRRSPAL